MLNSVLLYLDRAAHSAAVIRTGAALARPAEARLRGLTLLDTRPLESALKRESAAYLLTAQARQAEIKRRHDNVRAALSHACLEAGLDFDVRRAAGNPLQVLPTEARLHDLVIASPADDLPLEHDSGGLTASDLGSLLDLGLPPLLLVHPQRPDFKRVLLVCEGGQASGSAIRTFLGLGILRDAEHRLLAIGRDAAESRTLLREMADYCLTQRPSMETGYISGRTRKVLLPYAEKWQADLVVMGTGRGNRLWRRVFGGVALALWRNLSCGLFIAT